MNEETDTPETLADIIAEMRREAGKQTNPSPFYRYADRIEAAAEREYEDAKNYFAKLHDGPSMICTAKNCAVRNIGISLAAPGNAAALRDALEEQLRYWNSHIRTRDEEEMRKRTEAALAAPARNCDRFQTELDAQLAFLNDEWLISVEKNTMMERDKFENWTELMKTRYGRWLLAPAKKGGAE